MRQIVQRQLPVRSVVTVRHPLDSYLSLIANGWVDFQPACLEEYCCRYLRFLDDYDEQPIFKYEDFVEDTSSELEKISRALELPFNAEFESGLDLIRLTGDSGRSGVAIVRRERREVGPQVREEVETSSSYHALCVRLNYVASFEE